MANKAVFKGVLWDHGVGEINGTKVYKTVVVGMIVSSDPLDEATTSPDLFHQGELLNLQEAFKNIKATKSRRRLGDAIDVLASLGDL